MAKALKHFCTRVGLTPTTPEQVSVYIHNLLADSGEACFTEVIQDRKKKKPGDPDRFDMAVDRIIALIEGHIHVLKLEDFLDSNGEKITKGDTTVDLDVINAIVKVTGSKGIAGYLKQYPITNALIGQPW